VRFRRKDSDLGSLIVAGRRYEITRMAFNQGGIEVTAERTADDDHPHLEAAPMTVFGADGRGVFQGGTAHIPAHKRGERVRLEVFMDPEGGVTEAGVLPELTDLL
jgi:hypothetical protein